MSEKGKILTVGILGCGSRGFHAYGTLIGEMKEKFRIVALCDTNPVVFTLLL